VKNANLGNERKRDQGTAKRQGLSSGAPGRSGNRLLACAAAFHPVVIKDLPFLAGKVVVAVFAEDCNVNMLFMGMIRESDSRREKLHAACIAVATPPSPTSNRVDNCTAVFPTPQSFFLGHDLGASGLRPSVLQEPRKTIPDHFAILTIPTGNEVPCIITIPLCL